MVVMKWIEISDVIFVENMIGIRLIDGDKKDTVWIDDTAHNLYYYGDDYNPVALFDIMIRLSERIREPLRNVVYESASVVLEEKSRGVFVNDSFLLADYCTE